jgi:hypothetical protein
LGALNGGSGPTHGGTGGKNLLVELNKKQGTTNNLYDKQKEVANVKNKLKNLL